MVYFWFMISFFLLMMVWSKNRKIKTLKNELVSKSNASAGKTKTSPYMPEEIIFDEDTGGFDWAKASSNKISSEYLKPQKELADHGHLFSGKKVVITGEFNSFAYRDEMAKLLWEVGADVDSAVTKRTDYLIKGKDAGWKKLEMVKEHGVKVISEARFLKLFPDYESPYL